MKNVFCKKVLAIGFLLSAVSATGAFARMNTGGDRPGTVGSFDFNAARSRLGGYTPPDAPELNPVQEINQCFKEVNDLLRAGKNAYNSCVSKPPAGSPLKVLDDCLTAAEKASTATARMSQAQACLQSQCGTIDMNACLNKINAQSKTDRSTQMGYCFQTFAVPKINAANEKKKQCESLSDAHNKKCADLAAKIAKEQAELAAAKAAYEEAKRVYIEKNKAYHDVMNLLNGDVAASNAEACK